ncbi:MAG: FtsL-like putative cell division protein [Bacteroidia bacterium]
MANKFKEIKKEEPVIEEVIQTPSVTFTSKKKKSGIVKSLNILFGGTFLSNEHVLKHIPFILFLSVIAILYIANGYWADNKVRQVNKLSAQIKEFRSEYISTKSDLMFVSKQSEVAKSVEKLGIKEPIVPPMKIVVDTTNFKKQESTDNKKE